MNKIAHVYSSKRDCSLQEAVYNIMTELWLRKFFPTVVNFNNIPEKRVKIILSKKELSLLPEYSSEIYRRNIVSCYIIRPSEVFFN